MPSRRAQAPPAIQVIETKRKPPLWSVKADRRYVASFMGTDAREKALALASEMGGYTIRERAIPAREAKRRAAEG